MTYTSNQLIVKRSYLLYISVILSATILSSCEGYRMVRGQILDSVTKLPLDSVKCEILTASNQLVYSDTTGSFVAKNQFGGCVPKCRDIIIRLTKDKYKEQILTTPTDSLFFLTKIR